MNLEKPKRETITNIVFSLRCVVSISGLKYSVYTHMHTDIFCTRAELICIILTYNLQHYRYNIYTIHICT